MGRLKRLRYKRACNGEDRISQLPDEILISILSNLTCDQAWRTCLLSKRWRTCWTFVRAIRFDSRSSFPPVQRRREPLESLRSSYVTKVYRVLSLLKSPTVESVHFRCDLTNRYKRDIDSWIKFVLEKKPVSLELVLTGGSDYYRYDKYAVPKNLLTNTNIKSLKSITLGLDVTDNDFHYFISNCPFLENFVVQESRYLKNLIVAGTSLNLKYLKISNCIKMTSIQISAPKLLSFHHSGSEVNVHLKDAPFLTDLLIGGAHCRDLFGQLRQFFGYFSQLESLALDIIQGARWSCNAKLPQLTNLRRLEIIFQLCTEPSSLLSYVSLVKACPSLCSITIKRNVLKSTLKSSYDFSEKLNVEQAGCALNYLKVVEFDGFVGSRSDVEILMFLFKLKAPIDKLIVRIAKRASPLNEKQELEIIDRALNIELPPGTHILVLHGDGEKM